MVASRRRDDHRDQQRQGEQRDEQVARARLHREARRRACRSPRCPTSASSRTSDQRRRSRRRPASARAAAARRPAPRRARRRPGSRAARAPWPRAARCGRPARAGSRRGRPPRGRRRTAGSVPSIAANSSVTHSTPAARSPSTWPRCSAKWKTTNVVTLKSAIAGTACGARSSRRSSLRSSAPTVAPHRYSAPIRAVSTSPAGASRSARPARRPSARSASASPPRRVVARDDPRAPARGADQRLDQLGRRRVEVGARLVEQQQLGVVQHARGRPPGAGPCRASRCAPGRRRAPRARRARAARRRALGATPCRRAWKRRFSRPAEVAVEQRLVAEQADPPAHRPALVAAARGRARARCRRAGAAAWPARAAASTCPRRWGRRRRASRRRAARASRPAARPARRSGASARRAQWLARLPPSLLSVAAACSSTGASTPKSCSTAFGLPGKLTIRVRPATPGDAAREHPHRRVLERSPRASPRRSPAPRAR